MRHSFPLGIGYLTTLDSSTVFSPLTPVAFRAESCILLGSICHSASAAARGSASQAWGCWTLEQGVTLGWAYLDRDLQQEQGQGLSSKSTKELRTGGKERGRCLLLAERICLWVHITDPQGLLEIVGRRKRPWRKWKELQRFHSWRNKPWELLLSGPLLLLEWCELGFFFKSLRKAVG